MNARLIADWVHSFRFDQTGGAAATAGERVLDLLGVITAGISDEQSARVALDYAAIDSGQGERAQGESRATLFFRNRKVSAEAAAFAHAVAGHSIEMDDVHNASSIHPGVVNIPPALAIAESLGRTKHDLLEAIIAGYEVLLRVGEAAHPTALYARGFHPTAVCGVFASATVAAKLMKLTPEEIVNAYGLAWGFAAGNMSFQTEGSWGKRMQVGNTVRSGIQAARLASMGATGPGYVLDENGFFKNYSSEYHGDKLTRGLGTNGTLKIDESGIKPYACCRYIQAPVDGLLELQRQHRFNPDDVERIDIEIASTGLPLVAIPAEAKRRPTNSVAAQFSVYYSAGVALYAGAAGPREYREPWLSDARIHKLAERVHCGSSGEVDRLFPTLWPVRIKLKLRGGETLNYACDYCLGDREKPLGSVGLHQKFSDLSSKLLSPEKQDQIINWIEEADSDASVAQLTGFFAQADARAKAATAAAE